MSILYILIIILVCVAVILALYFLAWRSKGLDTLEGLVTKYSMPHDKVQEWTTILLNGGNIQESALMFFDDKLKEKELLTDFKKLLPQKYLYKIKCNNLQGNNLDVLNKCLFSQIIRDNAVNADTMSSLRFLSLLLNKDIHSEFSYDKKKKTLKQGKNSQRSNGLFSLGKEEITLQDLHKELQNINKTIRNALKNTTQKLPDTDCLCTTS